MFMSTALGMCLCCQKNQPGPGGILVDPAPPARQVPYPSPGKPTQARQIDKTWASKFTFGTRSIRKKHSGIRSYEIDVEYPEIEDDRTRATLTFNRWMKKKVKGYVEEFALLQQRAERFDRSRKLSPLVITEGLSILWKVYYSDDRLISLRLTHIVMAVGQMHPIAYYETINYDLRRGRPLHERSVFKRGYTRVFSEFSRKHIRDEYEMDYTNDEWLKSGTSAQMKNFPNWNIVPDGILISFEDYQIAAHVFGQLELIIPYGELKRVLRRTPLTTRFVRPGGEGNQ
jgi:hypothetical protein